MNKIRLGMVGFSEGNGHPYSWSAIINGYNRELMEDCGFPVIPRYLEKQKFPDDALTSAHVSHIWTQDKRRTEHIANTTYIPNVLTDLSKMIGSVDAVLLARDDAETHFELAKPFIEAGLPIYIDKPLALSTVEAEQLFAAQKYPGQVYSCSALRYAEELGLSQEAKSAIGEIRIIQASVPKSWDKYAVHIIEPALLLVPDKGKLINSHIQEGLSGNLRQLAVEYENGVIFQFSAMGSVATPISIKVFGTQGWKELIFSNAFAAFRTALDEFLAGIRMRDVRIKPEFMLEVVSLIQMGRNL